MEKIKIGQIGICHEHASGIIASLRKMPDVFEIVGVVDDTTTTAPRFAGGNREPYEGLQWMSEEELLDYPGLQAVAVEVPNTELVPTAMRCMQRNIPIHMDKPGGEDLDSFQELRKGCEERHLPFQMGYMFRNNPAMLWCRKAVRNGWLGDVFEVQANMSHDYGSDAYQDYLGNFRGGIMFNLGCHLIDFIVALLGSPKRITPFLKSTPEMPENIKNNCRTILEYPNAIVSLHASSREVGGLTRRRLKICGTKGSVELSPLERFDGEPLKMDLTLSEGNQEYPAGTHTVDFGPKDDRYTDHLQEFAQIIRGEIENPYTYEHDYLVQKVNLAASGYMEWS